MKSIRQGLLFVCCAVLGAAALLPAPAGAQEPHVAVLTVDGAIGPATTDYLTRSIAEAAERDARMIVIRMDTPGGLDAATRDIAQALLASPVPVATFVHPSGSRAASAGTYILYASHIAAMAPATTLGAATPVQIGGGGTPDFLPGQSGDSDEESGADSETTAEQNADSGEPAAAQPATAMERKIINDAVAFIRGLAEHHGRNADWAERAVREAVSLTATEALAQNVVDVVAEDVDDLIAQVDGREVRMEHGTATLDLQDAVIETYEPDWRNELLALITNPQIAYILLLVGIYGLILEGYNPGGLVPGVIGGISLLLAFYALQVMPVNYVGLGLIILGVLLIVAESFAPSFGILGIGGVVALTIGSVMLIDTDIPGLAVSKKLIGAIAAVSALAMLAIVVAIARSLRIKRVPAEQAMVGHLGLVREPFVDGHGFVLADGELWQAESIEPLTEGEHVVVEAQEGLKLKVKPHRGEEPS